MFFKKLFGRKLPERDAAHRLYLKAVEKARDPGFYLELGVADTVDGRFDMIVVHVMLVMRHLRAAGETGRIVAQELFDLMFRDMDRSLREMGVGDLSVGKHIKAMAKAFYGRAEAYEAGLDAIVRDGTGALIAALRELIYKDDASSGSVTGLADYLVRADKHIGAQDPAGIAAGDLRLDDVAVVQ